MKKVDVVARKKADEKRLDRLEKKGLIRRSSGANQEWLEKRPPVKVKGSVLKNLLDERKGGW